MRGRTTFMVAHRLSTLEHCDLLIVMDRGRARMERNVREFLHLHARELTPSTAASAIAGLC